MLGTVGGMLDPQLYALFLTAAVVLALAPGPDTLFVLGASLGDGTRGGLLASAGILTGLLAHISFAVVGVSMLIAASPLAFELLRWLGAGYLVWSARARTGAVPAVAAGRDALADRRPVFAAVAVTSGAVA